MSPNLHQFLEQARNRVDQILDDFLPNEVPFDEAVRYCVFNGGKRIRPALVYATADAVGIERARVDGIAAALELIHAYSLVHDDLPAMDDDALRRGKPTCHIAYDEATAVLVGDALQCYAFEALSNLCEPRFIAPLITLLAKSSGARGMILGQVLDIAAEGGFLNESELESMHKLKTGALINASVEMPALLSPHYENQQSALQQYSAALGLAFQIQDDILDVVADTETLGKPKGSDEAKSKPTYTSILGLDGARVKLNATHQQALEALETIDGDTSLLAELSHYVVNRVN